LLRFALDNLITFSISGVHCASQSDIDQHLSLGMQLLARGQYSDALSHFHAAIGKKQTYTCYLYRVLITMIIVVVSSEYSTGYDLNCYLSFLFHQALS